VFEHREVGASALTLSNWIAAAAARALDSLRLAGLLSVDLGEIST